MKTLKKIIVTISSISLVLGYILYGVVHLYATYLAYEHSNFWGVVLTFCFPVGGPIYWLFSSIKNMGWINVYSLLCLITIILWLPIILLSVISNSEV